MEKYTVFMDWKNQHCQNGHTTQIFLETKFSKHISKSLGPSDLF